jgi:nucleoside-diphosphate-sugar epimerase
MISGNPNLNDSPEVYLMTGGTGSLGCSLSEHWNSSKSLVHFDSHTWDITKPAKDGFIEFFKGVQVKYVIHAAAWTNVAAANDVNNFNKVYDINVEGTVNVCEFAKALGVPLIYISSDYVDAYLTGKYRNPDRYTLSKFWGEKAVKDLMEEYYILRLGFRSRGTWGLKDGQYSVVPRNVITNSCFVDQLSPELYNLFVLDLQKYEAGSVIRIGSLPHSLLSMAREDSKLTRSIGYEHFNGLLNYEFPKSTTMDLDIVV